MAHVLEEPLGLLDGKHGAVYEGVGILLVREGKEVVGALDALGEDVDVVVHEDDVGELGGGVHRGDHAAGKSSRAADVGVGDDGHEVIGEGLGVERRAVVDHEHVEGIVDGAIVRANGLTHELDVGDDVVLLLEGRRGERDAHRVDASLVDLGVIGAGMEEGRARGKKLERDEVHARAIERGADACDLARLGLDGDPVKLDGVLGVSLGAFGHALDDDLDGIAGELEPERHGGNVTVLGPLRGGARVQEGHEVSGLCEPERSRLLVVVEGARAEGVELIVSREMLRGLEKDVRELVLDHGRSWFLSRLVDRLAIR